MRVLFIGDIVGPPGLTLIKKTLPGLIAGEQIDLVIANAENAYNGSGLVPNQFRDLVEAGVNLITLGDHIYKRQEIIATLQPMRAFASPPIFPCRSRSAAGPGCRPRRHACSRDLPARRMHMRSARPPVRGGRSRLAMPCRRRCAASSSTCTPRRPVKRS